MTLKVSSSFVLTGMDELITLDPLTRRSGAEPIDSASLGILAHRPWIAVDERGKVAGFGEGEIPPPYRALSEQRVEGGVLFPGFVDSHTHPIWAGHRAQEFVLKAQGKTYQEIAQSGGGIRASVRATRQSSDEELYLSLKQRLALMVSHGVTTIEVKSGYGLSVEQELRLLKILSQTKKEGPYSLHVTCLALHAPSPDGLAKEEYIRRCSEELLPEAHRLGFIESVDAFVEKDYFEAKEITGYLQKAKDLGLGIRLHADEFSNCHGAQLGIDWQVQSLDHLQCMDPKVLRKFSKSPRTVATILPGTSLYSRIPFTQGKAFRDAEVPVAVASDFNPGSCLIYNLPLVASLAAVHSGLSVAEVVAGITLIPARSLGFAPYPGEEEEKGEGKTNPITPSPPAKKGPKGALSQGFDADMVLFPHKSLAQWIADFGQSRPRDIWMGGIKNKSL
jgi:imidazolonepropionase